MFDICIYMYMFGYICLSSRGLQHWKWFVVCLTTRFLKTGNYWTSGSKACIFGTNQRGQFMSFHWLICHLNETVSSCQRRYVSLSCLFVYSPIWRESICQPIRQLANFVVFSCCFFRLNLRSLSKIVFKLPSRLLAAISHWLQHS